MAPKMGTMNCISLCVCLSVCLSVCLFLRWHISKNTFHVFCYPYVSVAQSFSMCYVHLAL